MNFKSYFASTGSAFTGLVLAGAQTIGPGPTCQTVQSGSAIEAFARTATAGFVTVKVARHSDIWSTTNGLQWMRHPSGIRGTLYDVSYGNRVFVAVGNEGKLVTSLDGVTWTNRNSRTDERLRGIAFGNGIFVVVGYAGTVITSKDGVSWKIRDSGTNERLQMVTYDGDTFVAVGKGIILISPNGTRWKVRRPLVAESRAARAHRDENIATPSSPIRVSEPRP